MRFVNLRSGLQESRCSAKRRSNSLSTIHECQFTIFLSWNVTVFKNVVKAHPYSRCIVCNCYLCRKLVIFFVRRINESLTDDLFIIVLSFDNNYHICKTSPKNMKNQCEPYQAVINMLQVFYLQQEFTGIQRLKKVFTAMRLLVKQITITHKDES